MRPSQTLLVLWDIDHTLLETGGVGSDVYAAAFRKATGRALAEMADVSGRTEPVIFRETLARHGIEGPAQELFSRFAEEQARGYAERADELRQRGRALPGASDALDCPLHDREGLAAHGAANPSRSSRPAAVMWSSPC